MENILQDKEFTVSEISYTIKSFVETAFSKVKIRGEISSCKRADSGHYYLSLKDDNAVLSAVCWKGVAANLKVKPEDGLEVIATGKITTYPGKSNYQLVIEQMEVAGQGALLKLLEERKKKFQEEGLFDQVHKKPIPFLPNTIGVITSASGAVIRDIIHRITDRFPSHLLLWPTPVQGEGAAEKIAAAIEGFNNLPNKPDVLIVARGGGSLEDLWCFNEEVVIRAVFASKIPVISAVGHETDTMLIDYVSDLRAPTPTGAAEFAVPVKSEIQAGLLTSGSRLFNAINRFIENYKNKVEGLARGIPNLNQILLESQQKLDDRIERLNVSFKNLLLNKHNDIERISLRPYLIRNILQKNQENITNLGIRLDSVSIDSVLKRGFAWVKDDQSQTIYNVSQAKKSSSFEIRFIDGSIKTSSSSTPTKRKKADKKDESLQTSLFDI
ncbi:MAG: exodeoxyribonuclease VII large subunit [Lactobacillus sp.]|jgi:exodeoxyribonuclease VII large subunit|nr:exodeoxyribonuclease VII large subunit [Lactobacillus sp.]